MSVLRPTRTVSLLILAWVLAACRDSGGGEGARGQAPAYPAGCRSYAAAGDVRWTGEGGQLRCEFDRTSLEHTCDLAAGGARVRTRTQYASVADFIEAARHIGKVTSLRETRREGGAVLRSRHGYDELGRLVRSVEEGPLQTMVYAYSDYDGVGRPRRALARSGRGECEAQAVSFEYDDAQGRVRRELRAADPARCGFERRVRLERYDRVGNRVSIEEADGSGVATHFEAQRDTELRQVCL